MTYTLPPGTYYIGDPCYVFERESWDTIGEQTEWFHKTPIAELNGMQLLAFGTAYGDGDYADQFGNRYPVDAGLIGVVPVFLMERKTRDMRYITSDEPLVCSEHDGVLTFGKIRIDTKQEDEEA